MSQSTKTKTDKRAGKNPLEWTVFGFSSLLVIAVLGFLTYNAMQGRGGEARLRCGIKSTQFRGGNTEVIVEMENLGLKTAAEVEVEVASGPDVRASFRIDFVPRGGKREGIAVFDGPQDGTKIKARIVSYIEP